jgi:hypothetical protein
MTAHKTGMRLLAESSQTRNGQLACHVCADVLGPLDLFNLRTPHVAVIPDHPTRRRRIDYLPALTADLSLQPVHYLDEVIVDITVRECVSA